MDMKKYMTFKAVYKKCLGVDEDTHMNNYDTPKEIKCFKYGKDVFIRDKTAATTVTAQAYLTLEAVAPMDLIDGQVVKSVNSYPESFDSRNILYEVLTWHD